MALKDKIVFTGTCCLVSFYLGTQFTPPIQTLQPKQSAHKLSVNYNPQTNLYSYPTKCVDRNPQNLKQCVGWVLKKEFWK